MKDPNEINHFSLRRFLGSRSGLYKMYPCRATWSSGSRSWTRGGSRHFCNSYKSWSRSACEGGAGRGGGGGGGPGGGGGAGRRSGRTVDGPDAYGLDVERFAASSGTPALPVCARSLPFVTSVFAVDRVRSSHDSIVSEPYHFLALAGLSENDAPRCEPLAFELNRFFFMTPNLAFNPSSAFLASDSDSYAANVGIETFSSRDVDAEVEEACAGRRGTRRAHGFGRWTG